MLDFAALKMSSIERQVHMEVGSNYENIELVQLVVAESLARLELTEKDSGDISLAVREAVANAIKHGNRADPGKRVEVEVAVRGRDVVIRVTDEGKGFNPHQVPDPLEPQNLLRPNGRGILFMQRFMDEIDYTFRDDGGTVVTLRKHIERAPNESAAEPSAEPNNKPNAPQAEPAQED